MDNSDSFYYYFSTIAQVLAATIALVSIALQFQLNALRKYLLGDGQAVYDRINANEVGYLLDLKYTNRLRDSLGREDLDGIQEVLKILRDTEEKEGYTEKKRPYGLKHLYNRFIKMRGDIVRLKTMMKRTIFYSILTIILSILMLGFASLIKECLIIEIGFMIFVFILLVISLWKTYLSINEGLK